MPAYKVDLVFEANGRGWVETYYRNFPQIDFGAANAEITSLAQKRIKLSGNPVVIKAYRITDPLTSGRQGQSVYFTPNLTPAGAGGVDGAASPSTAININFINNATNKTRFIQMRGVWDDAIANFNNFKNPSFANWNTFFLMLRDFMLANGYGWLSATPSAPSPVSYAYGVGATAPTFTTPGNFWDALEVNTFQKARFSRFNDSNSTLNRELIVFVTSQTTAVAAAAIAAGPMTSQGRIIKYGTPAFTAASNIGVTRVGRRSPGAPLLYTPGRARDRARS